MLVKYHFEIEHIKKLNNARADALSRKEELQNNNKILRALLKLRENKKI